MIILLLFVFILSINSISASDDSDELTNASTFADLESDISAADDNINLTKSYAFDNSTDANFTDGVRISKNLTVVGKNNTYIDASHKARAFIISPNCSVTLKDLTFKNGYSQSNGGAINLGTNSTLTIINCTFINNKVYNSNGGAIAASKFTDITIINSRFSNNTSIRVSDLEWKQFKQGMGSAICVTIGSFLRLIDSNFTCNDAYLTTILLVSYDDVDYNMSDLYVKNCLFENNTSQSSGVIYLDELGRGEIHDSVFRNNHVTGSGGTLVLDACISALVKNSSFESNTAVKGGAIQIKVFEYDYRSNVTLTQCNFTKNSATEQGGAVYSKYGLTKISECTFNDNYCTKGGAIYAKFATLKISNSIFNRNTADYGGGLFLRTDNNYITTSIFRDNKASQKGGAIYDKEENLVSSSQCNYISNTAPKGADVYGVFTFQSSQTSSYYDDVQLTIRLASPWNMPLSQKVKLTFTGAKTYKTGWYTTDSNGILSLKVPKYMDVGSYTLKITLQNGVSYTSPTIIVKKAPAAVTLKKVTKCKYGKHLRFYVKNTKTNKVIANAKINIKVYTGKKYVTYQRTSDANGLVDFDTSGLSVGSHIVKISSQNNNVKFSKNQYTFKIKKSKAVIKAPKKVKRPSKIRVVIKNKVNNNPIGKTTFKIKMSSKKHSLTVYRMTNAKGVLKIKTKNLYRAKYNVKISLNNPYYKTANRFSIKIR